ncbi:MAG: hypothetical protein MUD08_12180 [Cytophagales bacterium]|nr:hypothetical protein [Cytophagales bacterium]
MKKILFLLFISCSAAAQSKVKYTVKAEAGYLKFLTRTITVDRLSAILPRTHSVGVPVLGIAAF